MELRDRCILVTGASSGIGEEAARQFARMGAKVVIVSEKDGELHQVADSIRATGGKVTPIVADFSKPEQVKGLIPRVEKEVAPVEVLVNNAGMGLGATLRDTTPDKLRLLFEVNFFALTELCRQALEMMSPRGRGRIINLSSAAARFGSAGVSAYSATKGAVHTYTQALRIEAAVYGILVSEILPISVRTKFFDNVEGKKYKPQGIVLPVEKVAESVVRCAASDHPKAEIYPYAPIQFVFVLDALFPGLLARFAIKRYRESWGKTENP